MRELSGLDLTSDQLVGESTGSAAEEAAGPAEAAACWAPPRRAAEEAGGRRRRAIGRRLDPRAARHRDLVALGVHALRVRHVVTTLDRAAVRVGTARSDRGTAEESHAGTRGGADGRIARGGPERRARRRAHQRADRGAPHRALGGGLVGRGTGLLRRPLAAYRVVDLEGLEALAGARHDHHARPGRDAGAPAHHQRDDHGPDDGRERRARHRRGGAGARWCQPIHRGRSGTFTHSSGQLGTVG